MKEPREWLQRIINDQYAMPSTHEYACKLYNLLRRQVGRRKRCMERRDLLLARIEELEAAMAAIVNDPLNHMGGAAIARAQQLLGERDE